MMVFCWTGVASATSGARRARASDGCADRTRPRAKRNTAVRQALLFRRKPLVCCETERLGMDTGFAARQRSRGQTETLSSWLILLLLIAGTAGQGPERDCSTAGGGAFIGRLIQRNEVHCVNKFTKLFSQGPIQGPDCAAVRQQKCCRSSDCAGPGHICDCVSECGVRACHLHTLQAFGHGMHCPNLLPPKHGRIVIGQRAATVRIECDAGYKVIDSASAEVTCLPNHKWSRAMPKCNALICNLPSLPRNSHFRDGSDLRPRYARGESLKVHCDPGYMTQGKRSVRVKRSRTIKCRRNKHWQFLRNLQCTPEPTTRPPVSCCSVPAAPKNGGRSINGTFCDGSTATYHCDKCHRLTGGDSIQVCDALNYTAPDLACQATTCPFPELPQGLSFDGRLRSWYPCGTRLPVMCTRPGRALSPAVELSCGEDGTWVGGIETLKTYMCEELPSPEHLTIANSSNVSVTVQWQAPLSYAAADVAWYLLTYLQAGASAGAGSRDQRVAATNGTVTAIVDDLTPDTQYYVRVKAVFTSRFSSEVSAWTAVRTSIYRTCSFPSLPPVFAGTRLDGQPLLVPTRTTRPDGQRVLAPEAMAGSRFAEFPVGLVVRAVCSGSAALDSADAVLLRCTHNGTWQGIETLEPFMCDAVPGAEGLTIMNKTTGGVTVQWRPPRRHHADVTSYSLTYVRLDGERAVLDESSEIRVPTAGKLNVSGLVPGTWYQFRVQATFRSKYLSAFTEWQKAATIPDAPRHFAVNGKYDPLGSAMLTRAVWIAPENTNAQTRYELTFYTMHTVASPYLNQYKAVTQATNLTLGNLQPFTEYSFFLRTVHAGDYSTPLERAFTLKSSVFRPRAPPAPGISINATDVTIRIFPSPDRSPFVWRYSVRATCDERDSVNSLEETDSAGGPRCPSSRDMALAKFSADEIDSSADGYVVTRLQPRRDPRFLPGLRYRLQVIARTKTKASAWSPSSYFTVPARST